jgi:cAMP-dependent protein kinase regulator
VTRLNSSLFSPSRFLSLPSPCSLVLAVFVVFASVIQMATFEALVQDLTRDIYRAQPKDVLQFCANWFQSRLEEQRNQTRDLLSRGSQSFPSPVESSPPILDLYVDSPLTGAGPSSHTPPPRAVSPYAHHALSSHHSPLRNSISPSPFGTLNIAGNALLSNEPHAPLGGRPRFKMDGRELPPTSPLTMANNGYRQSFDQVTPTSPNPGDFLHPPTSTIFARRTSVSAESIVVDGNLGENIPFYPKTPDQLRRIKASITNNFIFRDLDEEQESGVLNAMQERTVGKDEVVIRQGDVGEYFYVVESGLLHCYIRPEPLPPTWLAEGSSSTLTEEKFLQPGNHPFFGRKVAECKPGNSFGELALMYGHPRAATVLSMEPSTLWSLDRTTFRTIILKAAHRRRTMYEQFLSSVTLLSSLEPEERSKIADALVSRVYMDGEAVVRQGEMGDTFFFVEEGEATVTKTQHGDHGEITVGHLKKGDYFGGNVSFER